MPETPKDAGIAIYFSDFFSVDPDVLSDYGAFDVSLLSDMPLFVDPFLLFNSTDENYQWLHREIVRYLQFLLNKSSAGALDPGLIAAWFRFKEVKENWLGFAEWAMWVAASGVSLPAISMRTWGPCSKTLGARM